MANATIQFHVEGIDDIRRGFRELAAQFARMKAIRRERRAFLNMLRSTRRTRKVMVRKWQLAKLHAKAAEIRVQCPTAEVRVVSRNLRRGFPIAFIDIDAPHAKGTVDLSEVDHCVVLLEWKATFTGGESIPSSIDRRTLLLGHSPPIAILASSDPCASFSSKTRSYRPNPS